MCFKNNILVLLSILSILCVINISLKNIVEERYVSYDKPPTIDYNTYDYRAKDLYNKVSNINDFFYNTLKSGKTGESEREINDKMSEIEKKVGSDTGSINEAIYKFIVNKERLQNNYTNLAEGTL